MGLEGIVVFSGFDIHPTKKQRRQTTDYDNNYTFNHTYELENECNLNTTDYAGSVGSPPTFGFLNFWLVYLLDISCM